MDTCETRADWDLKTLGWKGFVKKLYAHHKPDGGALILRSVIGLLMLVGGWWKLHNMDMTIGFFTSMGFSAFQAYFVSWVEFIGGALLLVGFFDQTCVCCIRYRNGSDSLGNSVFTRHHLLGS